MNQAKARDYLRLLVEVQLAFERRELDLRRVITSPERHNVFKLVSRPLNGSPRLCRHELEHRLEVTARQGPRAEACRAHLLIEVVVVA